MRTQSRFDGAESTRCVKEGQPLDVETFAFEIWNMIQKRLSCCVVVFPTGRACNLKKLLMFFIYVGLFSKGPYSGERCGRPIVVLSRWTQLRIHLISG